MDRLQVWSFICSGNWTRVYNGQVLYKPASNNGQIVYKPVLTNDKLYTSLHPTTAPCCHFYVSFVDVIAPRNMRQEVRPMKLLATGLYFIFIPHFRCKYLPLLLEENFDGFFERPVFDTLWFCTYISNC